MCKKLISILLVIVMMLGFSGCRSVKDIITGDNSDDAAYQKSSTVNFAISNIKTLNPVVSHDEDTYYISKLIYQSLFSLDENLIPQNDLATEYTIGKNKKSVTITIDSKARFSDGEKVTASDVEFSVNAYKHAGSKSIYNSYVSCIASVEVKDSKTIKISFTQAGEGGINRLIFPILPQHIYSSYEELASSDKNFKPVGSGMYKVTKHDSSTKLILKPNDEYSGQKADNRLVFNIYQREADIMNLTDGNLVSFSINKDIDRQTEIGSKNLTNTDFLSNEVEYIGFNCESRITAEKTVRQAIAYAIDTDNILSNAYYSCGVKTDSLYYPEFYGTENKGDMYDMSRKKAKDLLEKAGFEDVNKDGYLENPDGNAVTVKILVNSNKSRKTAAEIVAENLEKISLKTQIVSGSTQQYKSYLKSGGFDIYIGGANIAEYYDLTPFIASGNYARYENAEALSIASNINTPDTVENLKSYIETLKKILSDELPYYPLLYKTYSAVVSDELTGEIAPLFCNYYINCGKWYSNYKITDSEK